MTPRGLRNFNPGNIRKGTTDWQGMDPAGNDPAFITFKDPVYGIRAMAKILLNYEAKYGLKTIRQIISRWAPPDENDTEAYIEHVAKDCGVGPDDRISLKESPALLSLLVEAIIEHENGEQPYTIGQITKGINLAQA